MLALAAGDALVGVDLDAEKAELAHQTQQRAHGADGVAPQAAVHEAHEADDHEGDDGNDQRQARGVDVGHHAGVGAIGGYEGRDGVEAEDHQQHEERQHGVAQPVGGLAIAEGTALAENELVEPGEDVLEDAHGADDGTIEAADEEGHQQDGHDHYHVECQHGREELHLGHPAQPVAQNSAVGGVEQQRRDAEKHQRGENDTYVFEVLHFLEFLISNS